MNRQTVIRGVAISFAGVAASVFGVSEFMNDGPALSSAGEISQTSPVRGASLSGLGQPAAPAVDTPVVDTQVSALDLSREEPPAARPAQDFQPELVLAENEADDDATFCTPSLQVEPAIDGLVDLQLTAPCNADERVVISHGDLAFSAMTDADGQYSTFLPALSETVRVDAFLTDDSHLQAVTQLPEVTEYARMVVQWTGSDDVSLHAFHRGADYGGDGHIHALNPFDPTLEEAFLVALGDAMSVEPMLAQVYSVPMSAVGQSRLQLEVTITAANCGSDLVAHVLPKFGAQDAEVRELGLSMPDCDATGDMVLVDLPFAAPTPQTVQMLDLSGDQS